MTITDFREFLKSWANLAIPNVPFIRRNADGTRPPLPYIDFKVSTRRKYGTSERSNPDDEGYITIKIQQDMVISIEGHGDDSEEILEELQLSLETEKIQQFFFVNCVAIRDVNSDIKEIGVLYGVKRERLYLYEPIFGIAMQKREKVGLIETIEIGSNLFD